MGFVLTPSFKMFWRKNSKNRFSDIEVLFSCPLKQVIKYFYALWPIGLLGHYLSK
jgi:hypothetical protein